MIHDAETTFLLLLPTTLLRRYNVNAKHQWILLHDAQLIAAVYFLVVELSLLLGNSTTTKTVLHTIVKPYNTEWAFIFSTFFHLLAVVERLYGIWKLKKTGEDDVEFSGTGLRWNGELQWRR